MQTHHVTQGSPEWLALRTGYFTASEAPAMMGASPYLKRDELLRQKATGLMPEVDEFTQRRFDDGHRAEAAFRPIAESIIGDELYPVTGTIEIEGLKLLASFDGLTMIYDGGFEHKLFNAKLAEMIRTDGEPGPAWYWQLEHQLLVSGAERILFVTSDGTEANSAKCWYTSKPERRAQLIAGWKQFAADLAEYVPVAASTAAPVGRAPETLPALRIEVTGSVTASNLIEFKSHALAVFEGINRDLVTDEDFADAEKTVKWCSDVEDRLKAAKEHALSQTADIDTLFRAIDEISASARTTRLELDRLVKARKETIRLEIVTQAQVALGNHLVALNNRIGRTLMPTISADFAGAIKGKRTIDSLRDAANTELARVKMEASEVADRITLNLRALDEHADRSFLFHDLQSLVLKQPNDLQDTIKARVSEHEAKERARKEEAERLEREASAKANQPAAQVAAESVLSQVAYASIPVLADVAQPDDGARLKLGEINARLAPIQITADGLLELGFEPVAVDRSAKLYRASDLPRICAALTRHIQAVAQQAIAQPA